MQKSFLFFIASLLLLSCEQKVSTQQKTEQKAVYNQALVDELAKMVIVDQIAASHASPPEDYAYLTQEKWEVFKDSVFRLHKGRAKEILDEYGFAGYDLVGKEGASNFWLLVQHADHDPTFQEEVLEKMKIEVDQNNANSRNYGLLVDRVRLNTGKAQIYGTQVTYNMNNGQAYPKKLEDSIHVNERRRSIGFEPIEEYLNHMSEMHFEMNREYYTSKGVTEPTFYKTN